MTCPSIRPFDLLALNQIPAWCIFLADCKVGDWEAWGVCSRSCDGGIKTKAREVLQALKHGGVVCPILEETTVCNTDQCKGTIS